MSGDEEPFLEHKEDENYPSEGPLRINKYDGQKWSRKTFLLVQLFLLAIYTSLSIIYVQKISPCQTIYSNTPLKDLIISYKPRKFVNLTNNPFAGDPHPDIDASWENLLGNMNLRVTEQELAANSQESVHLPENGGQLAWLGSLHELHCVNMLRKWNYRDYYHPNMTPAEYTHWASHADHCLDLWRQTAMCHGDVSLTSFAWNETKAKPMFDARESWHRCVDFDALVASVRGRLVSVEEIGRLKNPVFVGMNGTH